MAVLGKRGRRQVLELRAEELLEQALAIHRLQLRAVKLEGIDREAPGASLGQRALQHLLAARAPELQRDAVFLLEGLGDGHQVLEIERGVDQRLALLLRALENPLVAIRPLVHVQIAMRALRLQPRRAEKHQSDANFGDTKERAPKRPFFATHGYLEPVRHAERKLRDICAASRLRAFPVAVNRRRIVLQLGSEDIEERLLVEIVCDSTADQRTLQARRA